MDPDLAASIVASLHEGILVHGPDDEIVWWNDRVLEMLGLDADHLRGAASLPEGWQLVDEHGDRLPSPRPDVLVMDAHASNVDVRIGVQSPDGPTRWFRVSTLPLSGGRAGAVTSFLEETERVAAEREVALARDRFSALVEQSTDLITVLVPGAGRYEYTSPAWKRLLGWHPGDLTVDELATRIHPDDLDRLIAVVLDLQTRPGSIEKVVFRVRHQDGSWRYLDTTITNLTETEAVRGLVLNSRDMTDQVETAAELTQLALHDGLTGLANRRLVLDRIGHALEEQRRHGSTVAVLFLDLDDFKAVNDAYGHAAGDELLVIVGQRLSGAVRAADTVGRLGGDEFVVVSVVRDPSDVGSIAGHVDEALLQPIRLSKGVEVRTSASVGVVVSRPEDPLPSEELLARADSAMYEVKRHRRRLRTSS